MTFEQYLIVSLLIVVVSLAGLSAFLAWKSIGMLMWFHRAGQSLAGHQLQEAQIQLETKRAEAARAQAEAERARAEVQARQVTAGPTRHHVPATAS